MEPETSLPHSQVPAACPYLCLGRTKVSVQVGDFAFHNKIRFKGEELLAPRPTPKAGGPPLVGCPRLLIQ